MSTPTRMLFWLILGTLNATIGIVILDLHPATAQPSGIVIELQPTGQSEIVFDEVIKTTYANGEVSVRSGYTLDEGESLDFDFYVDHEENTYEAMYWTDDSDDGYEVNEYDSGSDDDGEEEQATGTEFQSNVTMITEDFVGIDTAKTNASLIWTRSEDNTVIARAVGTHGCTAFFTGARTTWGIGYCVHDPIFRNNTVAMWIPKGGYFNFDFLNNQLETISKHWIRIIGGLLGSSTIDFDHITSGEAHTLLRAEFRSNTQCNLECP